MEPNEDIAAPDADMEDMDTVELPASAPNQALTRNGTPADMDVTDEAEAIEDTETTVLHGIGAADISSEDTIQFAASKSVAKQRVDDGDDDVALADTMVETPAVLMPVVRDMHAAPHADTPSRAQAFRTRIAQIPWLRYPEFWLVVALAAFLRLWRIDLTEILNDQVQQLILARGAWLHGALPVTGIAASIGDLSPPLTIYTSVPFVALGKDP